MLSLPEAENVLASAEIIVSASEIQQALDTMAAAINKDYAQLNPLVLCIMNGGLYTTAELVKRLSFPLQMDYMQVSRYRDKTEGGEFAWRVKPAAALSQRHVLIVDDIFDEGITLQHIAEYCHQQNAASVKVAVLTRKQHDRFAVEMPLDYIGLTVPDRYVFGCGMDYKSYFRNLNAIYALAEKSA